MKLLKFLKSKKIKRYLILNKSLITIFAISLSILSLFLISNFINQNQLKTRSKASSTTEQTFLQGGFEIGVVSMNTDQACTNNARGGTCPSDALTLKEGIRQSLAEGRQWDIVGFQETLEPEQKPERSSETQEFITIMKELVPDRSYQCIKQSLYSGDFFSAICSAFPFIEGTRREFQIYENPSAEQRRVVICSQVQSPAGNLVICN